MRKILCVLLAAATSCAVLAQEKRGIGYPSVAAALADLKSKKDTNTRIENGWTIIDDKAGNAVWSFAPPGHPAFPAAIKRAIVATPDGKTGIAVTSLCHAGKKVCDHLIDQFEKQNQQMHADPVPDIAVQQLADDAFRLTLTSSTSKSAEAGQQELLPRARQLCGARNANFGKFQFNLNESIRDGAKDKSQLVLTQTIRCGDPAPEPVSRHSAPFTASAEQIKQVEQLTMSYFGARDERRYPDAYALFAPAQKQAVALVSWQANVEAFNARAGALRQRAIRNITWYLDPPQAAPGVYAAVDFDSQFANMAVHCGFVAWQQQKDGSFLLVREEENSLDKATAQKLQPAELEKVRARLGCKA